MSESTGEVEELLDVLTNAPDTAARVHGLNRLTALIERSHGAEAEALGELYRQLEIEGDPLTLANNQLSPFSAVFFVTPDQDIDAYSVRARLSSAERGGECWTALEVAGDDDP